MAQLAGDEAEILSIGVAPDWQQKGLGRRLLDGLGRALQKAEAKKLFLEVAADNDAALKLYSRAGFLGTGLRRGYYERTGAPPVDAVTLALRL
jgi:[ribosomal protein S18]-alanine N-acetyltransferase